MIYSHLICRTAIKRPAIFSACLACVAYNCLYQLCKSYHGKSQPACQRSKCKKDRWRRRSSLFMQFMMESLVVSLLALIVTVIIIQICLPAFNAVTEKHFELPITSVVMWQILTGTLLFATILNGIYPAVLLSSFKPINVFRGRSISVKDASVRKGLVVFQFALSMLLIVGATVIYKQLQYVQTANPGYDVAQVMSLQIPYDAYDALDEQAKASFFENFKHDLQSQSSIGFVCRGSSEIVNVEV